MRIVLNVLVAAVAIVLGFGIGQELLWHSRRRTARRQARPRVATEGQPATPHPLQNEGTH
jgi:hypothetical protein